jgi:hypothetical protein
MFKEANKNDELIFATANNYKDQIDYSSSPPVFNIQDIF